MIGKLVKRLALSAVAANIRAPENPICRYLELTHLRDLLRSLDIDMVLDVGANRGQFATELRQMGCRGQIVSFEPLRREYSILEALFRKDAKWRGFNCALGREDGTASINVFADLTVMSSILEPVGRQKNVEVECIEIRQLNSLFPQLMRELPAKRIFLKMDTQGFDLEVFAGAQECLLRIHGLQSELSVRPIYRGMPHFIEALSVYENAGFELYDLTVVSRTPIGGLQELNCFMQRNPAEAARP